ncbi:MAG: helix-turn-helix transcriptional regulator [Alphaproteobacteria bacterium]|nr:helix-turn-helix transcriptional regulator [Alphaproteobacteria bacterium]
MARAALDWSVRDLASRSGLSPNTVSRIENGADAYGATLKKLEQTLIEGGVEFIPENGGGPGVRLVKPRG